jgi:SAM-dependent methyltransferase
MAPTTDGEMVRRFYDRLAVDYDRMTGSAQRVAAERPFFQLLADRYNIRTAVDAGAGTGFHSLLLSELGIKVSAVDVSSAMVAALRKNARSRGVAVETIEASFEDIPRRLGRKFDAVFCMGNSLPHILTDESLSATLKAFRALLEPGGILFLQIVNYHRILATRERMQNVKEEGEKIFVRFYDFEERRVRFNILAMTRTASGFESHLESVSLRPWTGEDLHLFLQAAGFSSTKFFGGVAMGPYEPTTSKDLVILAQY